MSGGIKNFVSTCEVCREYERNQRKETLMIHEIPSRPWKHVAADLFEHAGRTYLATTAYFGDFFKLKSQRL